MNKHSLKAISPIDGRYCNKVKNLENYFSEYALFKYRINTEIEYFIALCELPIPQLKDFPKIKFSDLRNIVLKFDIIEAKRIKEIESTTNHDIKAVEYYLKEVYKNMGLETYIEFIHFGLTSQDINNTATPALLRDAIINEYIPCLKDSLNKINQLCEEYKDIAILARTHGQPASPTSLGKEFKVFAKRLETQLAQLQTIPFSAKFGGATGNFNAHYVAYPAIDWHGFANDLLKNMGLSRSFPTTQIEHYDNLAAQFNAMQRINTILIDLSRDIWTYISFDYFKQKIKKGEVGSSAMPHKVNPIDFENAEGNLGIANAIFEHLAAKLPISRLQRDLTDSTVLRNIGVPIAHSIIAFNSIAKGLDKLLLNQEKISADLENNWVVVAEAIQTILRRESYPQAYEVLKNLTRVNKKIGQKEIHNFIDTLNVSYDIKQEMKNITPYNYLGK
jgi:adenylosuccinate lyase